jgi:predicted PurR-regulated permease PerM
MVSQATRLAAKLPGYQQTLSDKIESLRGLMGGSGTLEQASVVLKQLQTELQHGDETARSSDLPARPTFGKATPVPVEIQQPDPGALTTLAKIIEPLLSPLTRTGVVVIFVAFILLQREDLRHRLVRLAGSEDIQRTTAALDDAGKRLSKLFLTQIIFNAMFGLAIGTGLELIGVPSAPLWGLIAMILRFVPYIGALISAAFPLILAAAVDPGWGMFLLTALLFAVLELLAAHVFEPLIYGHSSGLSPVAIVLSASFWTWLWGPVGLVMATPLTICLVVLGRHVERLKFLDIMLGDRPPLSPPQLVYQRMLAGDPLEAAEQAHDFLRGSSLEEYCDSILLEGLRLAEADRRLGHLNEERLERIASTVDDMIAHLEARDAELARAQSPDLSTNIGAAIAFQAIDQAKARRQLSEAQNKSPRSVLCIPGSGKLDEALVVILVYLLRRRGIEALAEEVGTLSMSKLFSLDMTDTSLACVCYIGQPSTSKIQDAIRKLNKKNSSARILLALFGRDAAIPSISSVGATMAIGSFRVALEAMAEIVSELHEGTIANTKDSAAVRP